MQENNIINRDVVTLVDVDFMNATHLEEVDMVNYLGRLIVAYDKQDKPTKEAENDITLMLGSWLLHTHAHFESENALMSEMQFPAYTVHMGEHDVAFEKMASVVEAWRRDKDIALIKDYVFYLWPAWFEAHVTSMDLMTARFAVMNGFETQAVETLATGT